MSHKRRSKRRGKIKAPIKSVVNINHLTRWQRAQRNVRIIWFWLSIIITLFAFWISSFALTPKVELQYNSYILPTEPLALPLKIRNNSFWSIKDVSLVCRIKFEIKEHATRGFENYQYVSLASKINSNSSRDHIFEGYGITNIPSDGLIVVTLSYFYSFLNVKFEDTQSFLLVHNRNGETRWVTIATPDSVGHVTLPTEMKHLYKNQKVP